MNRRLPLLLALAFLALTTGCASRTEREALRQCTFTPRSTQRLASGGDSMVVSMTLEIRNPGPSVVVLDSFSAMASTSRPIARLSHGLARRIQPGQTDTVALRFSMANQDLLATAFSFLMAPPDSIGIEGVAWVPQFFGLWTSEKGFSTKLPYRTLASSIQGLLQGAPAPAGLAPLAPR